MVSFDICQGNPGALKFLIEAYDANMFLAEEGFSRMQRNGIVGSELYIIWNDCCGRNVRMALEVMAECSIDYIKEHINQGGGRGIKIDVSDLLEDKKS